MHWTEIKLSEKMNQTLKECLEIRKDSISLYALKRIDYLESEINRLSDVKKLSVDFKCCTCIHYDSNIDNNQKYCKDCKNYCNYKAMDKIGL